MEVMTTTLALEDVGGQRGDRDFMCVGPSVHRDWGMQACRGHVARAKAARCWGAPEL